MPNFPLPLDQPLFVSPPALLGFLASLLALILGLARVRALQRFFHYCPPLIWTYFVPMICSSLGLIPSQSELYTTFIGEIILPMTIVLLLVPTDTRSIARLGPKAVIMMLIGTLGIVVGAAVAYAIVRPCLAPDAWKGVAALSGSWIGGSPNMAAVAQSLNADPTLFGKLVVVDTVCAYTWLGVLVALSGYQDRVDRRLGADNRIVSDLARRLSAEQAERARPTTMFDLAVMVALSLALSQLCVWAGEHIGGWVDAREAASRVWKAIHISQVLSGFGWAVLLLTGVSIALSLTRLRHLDDAGATHLGNLGLYLLLTTFGARADLRAIRPEDGWLFVLGLIWIAVHVVFLLVGMRLLRAPLFLGATSSMANIGGTASTPVVAAAFHRSLAPVGLVMALMGSLMGTPVALLVVGKICAWIAGAS